MMDSEAFRAATQQVSVPRTEKLRCLSLTLSTVSFAGLWYLALYLSAKFNVVIPQRPTSSSSTQRHDGRNENNETAESLLLEDERMDDQQITFAEVASPPVFLLLLPYVSLGLSIFIAGTRYFDFRSHGFDVLAGAAIGTTTAWFGFRWYNPPLSSFRRDAWAPRKFNRAFG